MVSRMGISPSPKEFSNSDNVYNGFEDSLWINIEELYVKNLNSDLPADVIRLYPVASECCLSKSKMLDESSGELAVSAGASVSSVIDVNEVSVNSI